MKNVLMLIFIYLWDCIIQYWIPGIDCDFNCRHKQDHASWTHRFLRYMLIFGFRNTNLPVSKIYRTIYVAPSIRKVYSFLKENSQFLWQG